MTPVRGDLGERPHDKATLMSPGVRKGQYRRFHEATAMIDQIEIKGAISVSAAANPTKPPLNLQQTLNRRFSVHRRLDNGDPVAILIRGKIRPGGRPPPGRSTQHRQSRLREKRESGFEQIQRRSVVAGKVRSQRNDRPNGPGSADATLRKTLTQ